MKEKETVNTHQIGIFTNKTKKITIKTYKGRKSKRYICVVQALKRY